MENKNNSTTKIILDVDYDKLKLLYEFSKILHFIDHHALDDSKKVQDTQFHVFLQELKKDVEGHIIKIKKLS